MTVGIFDRFWHRTLRRPYKLARVIDAGQPEGAPVVLLHGIGRTGEVWQRVVELLAALPVRIVAFDLLGFGASPKPDWPLYDIDDHARAVIAALQRLRPAEPAILVGHSMGCLVAVRVARLRPDLVRHLVLYEMPLYDGLPGKRLHRLRLNLYARIYRYIIRYQPTFDAETRRKLTERLARRIVGFEVTRATWQPFVKSLEHTIMEQTTGEDIKQITIPMDIIYGTFDMFVIRGKPTQFIGEDADHVKSHTIRERHVISQKASRFLVERVAAALERPAM
ncbi:MAG TPA: alpha/beta hydrolase [Candidatus Dormibacteraeota bacterium]|nr:alpha/beta hydrolase [Candidatus Dormibacteraeota bacterium]